jgi:hypothetical protein
MGVLVKGWAESSKETRIKGIFSLIPYAYEVIRTKIGKTLLHLEQHVAYQEAKGLSHLMAW